MAIIYDHAVIYNGVFYPAGAAIKEPRKAAAQPVEPSNKAVGDSDKSTAKKPKPRTTGE